MHESCRWIAGNQGVSNATVLQDIFIQKILAALSKTHPGEFLSFDPWMSDLSFLPEAKLELFRKTQTDKLHGTCILTNPDDLNLISRIEYLQHIEETQRSMILQDQKGGKTRSLKVDNELRELSLVYRFRSFLNNEKIFYPNWLLEAKKRFAMIIIPARLESGAKPLGVSSSDHRSLGAIFLCFPETGEAQSDWAIPSLLISLAHEIGHQVLMTYERADPIISSDRTALVYSGVRQSDRPAILTLHAATALVYMYASASFMQENVFFSEQVSLKLEVEARKYKEELIKTVYSLRQACNFTDLGEEIMRDLERWSIR